MKAKSRRSWNNTSGDENSNINGEPATAQHRSKTNDDNEDDSTRRFTQQSPDAVNMENNYKRKKQSKSTKSDSVVNGNDLGSSSKRTANNGGVKRKRAGASTNNATLPSTTSSKTSSTISSSASSTTSSRCSSDQLVVDPYDFNGKGDEDECGLGDDHAGDNDRILKFEIPSHQSSTSSNKRMKFDRFEDHHQQRQVSSTHSSPLPPGQSSLATTGNTRALSSPAMVNTSYSRPLSIVTDNNDLPNNSANDQPPHRPVVPTSFSSNASPNPRCTNSPPTFDNRQPPQLLPIDLCDQHGSTDSATKPNRPLVSVANRLTKATSTCLSPACPSSSQADNCKTTLTEPDMLGPCEPGTAITLDGIVWLETDTGVLVVNVTWRGRTYIGTLLDSSQHDFTPNCQRDYASGFKVSSGLRNTNRSKRYARSSTNKSTADTSPSGKGTSSKQKRLRARNSFDSAVTDATASGGEKSSSVNSSDDDHRTVLREGVAEKKAGDQKTSPSQLNSDGRLSSKKYDCSSLIDSNSNISIEDDVGVKCSVDGCEKRFPNKLALSFHLSHTKHPTDKQAIQNNSIDTPAISTIKSDQYHCGDRISNSASNDLRNHDNNNSSSTVNLHESLLSDNCTTGSSSTSATTNKQDDRSLGFKTRTEFKPNGTMPSLDASKNPQSELDYKSRHFNHSSSRSLPHASSSSSSDLIGGGPASLLTNNSTRTVTAHTVTIPHGPLPGDNAFPPPPTHPNHHQRHSTVAGTAKRSSCSNSIATGKSRIASSSQSKAKHDANGLKGFNNDPSDHQPFPHLPSSTPHDQHSASYHEQLLQHFSPGMWNIPPQNQFKVPNLANQSMTPSNNKTGPINLTSSSSDSERGQLNGGPPNDSSLVPSRLDSSTGQPSSSIPDFLLAAAMSMLASSSNKWNPNLASAFDPSKLLPAPTPPGIDGPIPPPTAHSQSRSCSGGGKHGESSSSHHSFIQQPRMMAPPLPINGPALPPNSLLPAGFAEYLASQSRSPSSGKFPVGNNSSAPSSGHQRMDRFDPSMMDLPTNFFMQHAAALAQSQSGFHPTHPS